MCLSLDGIKFLQKITFVNGLALQKLRTIVNSEYQTQLNALLIVRAYLITAGTAQL
jgi:hypothetical protein